MQKYFLSGLAVVIIIGAAIGIYVYEHTATAIAKVPAAVTQAADAVKDANTSVTDALRAIGTTSSSASVSATTGD